MKALRRRIPTDASPDDVSVADEARDVILRVMRGEVTPEMAGHRLKAATYVRLEVCGPPTQPLQLMGAGGGAVQVSINLSRAAPDMADAGPDAMDDADATDEAEE